MVDTPKKESSRIPWGTGRIAFTAQRQRIEEMMAQGYPNTMIYEQLKPHLNGLSYSQFNVLVRKKINSVNSRASSDKPNAPSGLESSKELLANDGEPVKKWKPKKLEGSGFKSFVPSPVVPDPSDHW